MGTEGRRLGIRFENGRILYYDIDSDGKVYWLRPRAGDSKMQRYKLTDGKLVGWVKELARKQAKEAGDD